MTAEEYRALLDKDFDDADELTDIKKVHINRSFPLNKRKEQYLQQIGNPYLVKIGNVKMKVRFSNNGISFCEAFQNMLLTV